MTVSRAAAPVTVAMVFLILWQLTCSVLDIPVFLVPAPIDVAFALGDNLALIAGAFAVTAYEALLAFVISALIGLAGALLLSTSRLLERSLYPYAILLQTIPVIATAPLIIIWFKVSLTTVVVIATVMAFVPVLSSALVGLRSTDRRLLELFRLYGAGRTVILFRLRLPAALPYIVSGLRVSSGMAVIGVIVAEYISGISGTQPGLGFLITRAASRLETPLLFAAGLACAVLGIVFFQLTAFASRRLLGSWHESELRETS